jgi:hypothetical protein
VTVNVPFVTNIGIGISPSGPSTNWPLELGDMGRGIKSARTKRTTAINSGTRVDATSTKELTSRLFKSMVKPFRLAIKLVPSNSNKLSSPGVVFPSAVDEEEKEKKTQQQPSQQQDIRVSGYYENEYDGDDDWPFFDTNTHARTTTFQIPARRWTGTTIAHRHTATGKGCALGILLSNNCLGRTSRGYHRCRGKLGDL